DAITRSSGVAVTLDRGQQAEPALTVNATAESAVLCAIRRAEIQVARTDAGRIGLARFRHEDAAQTEILQHAEWEIPNAIDHQPMPLIGGRASATRMRVELILDAATTERGLRAATKACDARQIFSLGERIGEVCLESVGEAPACLDEHAAVPLLAERPQH